LTGSPFAPGIGFAIGEDRLGMILQETTGISNAEGGGMTSINSTKLKCIKPDNRSDLPLHSRFQRNPYNQSFSFTREGYAFAA
jgi:hypothetical protein